MENELTYNISASINEGILEITFTGALTNNFHDRIVSDAVAIIKENSIDKVLIDISNLDGRIGIIDTYSRVRTFPSCIYNIRFTMVNSKGQNVTEHFQETTALNAGINVKWFTDIDAARTWLKDN